MLQKKLSVTAANICHCKLYLGRKQFALYSCSQTLEGSVVLLASVVALYVTLQPAFSAT